ncbi:hypothetical protein FB645_003308 [Coemansia sp. IMI 203386]|nr:hypothetical protein FB645_003308 [Coemansia sp. IMI 203386]
MSVQNRPALPANRYRCRTAVKDGPCFVCSQLTGTVFVADQSPVADWFYVCPAHTRSPSFCSVIEDSPAEGKGEVKSEVKNNAKDKVKVEDKAEVKAESDSKPDPKPDPVPEPVAADAPPNARPHIAYTLHRDVFYLRIRPFIQQFEKQQSNRLVQRLPKAPNHLPK